MTRWCASAIAAIVRAWLARPCFFGRVPVRPWPRTTRRMCGSSPTGVYAKPELLATAPSQAELPGPLRLHRARLRLLSCPLRLLLLRAPLQRHRLDEAPRRALRPSRSDSGHPAKRARSSLRRPPALQRPPAQVAQASRRRLDQSALNTPTHRRSNDLALHSKSLSPGVAISSTRSGTTSSVSP